MRSEATGSWGSTPPPSAADGATDAHLTGLLVFGPGERLARLARHAEAAGGKPLVVDDLVDLFPCSRSARRIVVDAVTTPREDLGILRRVLQTAGAELWVVAEDPSQGMARELCGPLGGRWLPWPPTLDEVGQLVQVSTATASAVPMSTLPRSPVSAPHEPEPLPIERDQELDRIDAILGLQPRSTSVRAVEPAPLRDPPVPPATPVRADTHDLEEVDRILGRALPSPVPGLEEPLPLTLDAQPVPAARDDAFAEPAVATSTSTPSMDTAPRAEPRAEPRTDPAPKVPHSLPNFALASDTPSRPTPAWMRDQVADLADQTTRIDLSLAVLTDQIDDLEEGKREGIETQVQQVRGETARLMGFARTLAFLATPPARGDQVFDVGEVLKVYVAGVAKSGAEAPRILYRSAGPVMVRSDRGLLGVVFDALLFVARECSSRGVVVKAQVLAPIEGKVAVEIDFPTGPLDGRSVENIFTPYALRRVLPNLGPNALAAAQAIVVGQGGTLSLRFQGRGRALWHLELPLSDM